MPPISPPMSKTHTQNLLKFMLVSYIDFFFRQHIFNILPLVVPGTQESSEVLHMKTTTMLYISTDLHLYMLSTKLLDPLK